MADNVRFLTWQEVLDQLLSFLPPQWRANFTGKVLKRLFVAFALTLEGLYGLLAKVLRLSIISTSEGRWLRLLVRGIGMSAYGGVAAVAQVQFIRWGDTSTAVQIPSGTEVQTDDGQTFLTNEAATLQIGQNLVSVACTCTVPGTRGNVLPGKIISLRTPIQGINEVTNPDPATGGQDPESDASIRARVPQHLALLHRATIPATEAAITSQRDLFPEVVSFTTERRSGIPGYFRGVLSDASGGATYRPTTWTAEPGLVGTYWTPVSFPTVHGLVLAGWPCIRFGEISRDASGEEVWAASESAIATSLGNYRWFHDVAAGRLYARADGGDLNTLNLTIYAGVVWRALRELEQRWVAAGVGIDIIVPFVQRVAVVLTFTLEPDYVESAVRTALQDAVNGYLSSLRVGQALELENLYTRLNAVPGAALILVTAPESNVQPARDEILRSQSVTVIRVG